MEVTRQVAVGLHYCREAARSGDTMPTSQTKRKQSRNYTYRGGPPIRRQGFGAVSISS